MIIKDIAKQGIPEIGNILPLKKINIIPIKINKSIEIVVVPNFGEVNSHQGNVGIILEEKKEIIKERRCLQVNYVTFPTYWKVE